MGSWSLAVLLLAGAASAAAQGGDIISDRGEGFARSTAAATAPMTPDEAERAATEAAAARDLTPAPQPSPPPVEHAELEDALDAPDAGRIIRGRGGHDHVERRGGGLILDGEGRRLEILPVQNRLVETPPLSRAPDDLDGVLARLRLLTGTGAAFSLLLTAWLWRRKDA